MNHLERALGRAKNEMNLTEAEEASLKQALEWKMGEEKLVRIPEDYRHHAWWRGLALVLPLIVIFIAARQVTAPRPDVLPQVSDSATEMVVPMTVPVAPVAPPPAPVMLKRMPVVEPPVAPVEPQFPTMTPSAGGLMSVPEDETELLRATTSTSTIEIEE